jgi:transposase
MIRLRLTDDDRTAVQALRRDATLVPAERDRVEMVLLSDAGWGPPQIATHLGYCTATVRTALKRFPTEGITSLRRAPPGPPPDVARRQQVEGALDTLLERDRTWTAAQLAMTLGAEFGIALSTRQTRKYLTRMGARWRRVVRTLAHKQDPDRVARATAVTAALKKRPPPAPSASSTSMSVASPPPSP